MAASLLGGAAVGAVFGELLKAVLEIKNNATVFKQTLNDLRSTLLAVYHVVKDIEHRNNELGRPKEELESLIRKMEEGTKLVYQCSKIGRYNYAAKFRYQEQLTALADSLSKFFIIDMQAQTARDQKETLFTVRRILSTVNKFPLFGREETMASSSDSAPMLDDVSESETHYSSATETFSVEEAREHVDQVYVSESGSTAIQQTEDAAGANTTGKVMEAGLKVVLKADLYDDRIKKKAMKTLSGFSGVEAVSVVMKDKKLILTGDIDPIHDVGKLRKWCHTEILSVVKEEKEKEESTSKKRRRRKNLRQIIIRIQQCVAR